MSINNDISDAITALAKANEQLSIMAARTAAARTDEGHARNAVNDAQRQFDALVVAVKKSAPSDSDWTRQPGIPVP